MLVAKPDGKPFSGAPDHVLPLPRTSGEHHAPFGLSFASRVPWGVIRAFLSRLGLGEADESVSIADGS